ncbi:hypothetical protein PIROE2DRAFT_12482, partial [Piromyces sp. E2]
PVFVDCNVLYYNEEYLDRYNQEIPKTWDDFIKVGKVVLEGEKKANNTEFIAYNGYLADKEGGFCSMYEFIYSFRKSVDSPFPPITSKEAVNALKKMKEMKEEIASDEIFQSSKGFGMEKYFAGDSLFFKYWYVPTYISDHKKVTHLPGAKEGISGSAIGGYNLGINAYADPQKMNTTIKVFTYLTFKDVQRKVARDHLFFSPIPSLYYEEELCKSIDCEFFRNAQLIARPTNIAEDYNKYSVKFREYIFEFLYGNRTASDVLQDIENLTKIYDLSLSSDNLKIIFIFCQKKDVSLAWIKPYQIQKYKFKDGKMIEICKMNSTSILIVKKEDEEMNIIKDIIAQGKEKGSISNSTNSNVTSKHGTPTGSNSSMAAYKKIVQYHYKTSIDSLAGDDTGNTTNITSSNLVKNLY